MIKKIKAKISQDEHLSDIISSSVVSFSLRILGIGFGYLFILLISRNLGATAVGIFTLAFTILQIVSILGRFGLDTALLRFVAESFSQDKMGEAMDNYIKATVFAFLVSLLLSILTYILSPFIAYSVFNNHSLKSSFMIVSFAIVPFTLTYLNFEILRAVKMIRFYAFFQNLSTFMLATILLLLIINETVKVETVITIFMVATWVTWLLSQYKIFKLFKPYTKMTGKSLSAMLKTSLPMMVASSLMLIMGWTDTIMIGMFMDESRVGIYSVALKVATLTSITLMAINSMAAPKFAEFYAKNDMVSLQHIASHASKLIFWTSLPILLICAIFPEFILGIFGDEFKSAALALIILCIGQFVNAASGSVGYIMQMTGKEKVFQKVIGVSLLLNIIMNYLLIPKYGIEGAAIASMCSMVLWNLLSIFYIYKNLQIKTFINFKNEKKLV